MYLYVYWTKYLLVLFSRLVRAIVITILEQMCLKLIISNHKIKHSYYKQDCFTSIHLEKHISVHSNVRHKLMGLAIISLTWHRFKEQCNEKICQDSSTNGDISDKDKISKCGPRSWASFSGSLYSHLLQVGYSFVCFCRVFIYIVP